MHSIKTVLRQSRASIRRLNISYLYKFVSYQLCNSYFQQYILMAAAVMICIKYTVQVHWNFHIMYISSVAESKYNSFIKFFWISKLATPIAYSAIAVYKEQCRNYCCAAYTAIVVYCNSLNCNCGILNLLKKSEKSRYCNMV